MARPVKEIEVDLKETWKKVSIEVEVRYKNERITKIRTILSSLIIRFAVWVGGYGGVDFKGIPMTEEELGDFYKRRWQEQEREWFLKGSKE